MLHTYYSLLILLLSLLSSYAIASLKTMNIAERPVLMRTSAPEMQSSPRSHSYAFTSHGLEDTIGDPWVLSKRAEKPTSQLSHLVLVLALTISRKAERPKMSHEPVGSLAGNFIGLDVSDFVIRREFSQSGVRKQGGRIADLAFSQQQEITGFSKSGILNAFQAQKQTTSSGCCAFVKMPSEHRRTEHFACILAFKASPEETSIRTTIL